MAETDETKSYRGCLQSRRECEELAVRKPQATRLVRVVSFLSDRAIMTVCSSVL